MALFMFLCAAAVCAHAQSAIISGIVTDNSGAVVPNASIDLVNTATQAKRTTTSNRAGVYALPDITPGTYQITVSASGFQTEQRTDISVNIAANITLNFALQVGSRTERVVVNGSGEQINTVDATVSTVIGRRFVENLPLNGRSFQSLITLSPGVTVVPSSGQGFSGEMSVNGQRTEANYYTVDGISANTGATYSTSGYVGAGYSGATPQESALGTTQSIVSIDALEEFRETTSSYSAEYGRTPGGQFSFSTRSGTNDYHGSLFEYLRNDALDAKDYFDTKKLPERQNDFGGALGGPIRLPHLYNGRDKAFFFFSYEGLRLTNPIAATLYQVPSNYLRTNAPAELHPFLDAFPLGDDANMQSNGLDNLTIGYAAPSRLDTTSARIDYNVSDRFKIFGRYSYVPSESDTRQPSDPAQVNATVRNVQTLVLGASNVITPALVNEFRFGLTGNNFKSNRYLDNFGGATPLNIGQAPGLQNGDWMTFFLFYGLYPYYLIEPQSNRQNQLNITDAMTETVGRHTLKYGIDYRHLLTSEILPPLWEVGFYFSTPDVLSNTPAGLYVYRQATNMKDVTPNFSAFAQDEWKTTDRLNLSLGVRWDVNPAPHDAKGNNPYTVNEIADLATVQAAPKNTPLWQTVYTNFAPRVGIAYQLFRRPGRETVLRAGGGLFYDTGETLSAEGYFGLGTTGSGVFTGPFPATIAQVQSTPTPSAAPPYNSAIFGYDPHLKAPYTGEWNVAIEQALGQYQSLTLNYVASIGDRLLAQHFYHPEDLGNAAFSDGQGLYITSNQAASNYNAFQLKFDRKLSAGLQFLASYTWSHAIDNASSNFTIFELERSSSDYDIRNNFQAALSYDIGGHYSNRAVAYALQHWALDTRISARSALPVDVLQAQTVDTSSGASVNYHPNRVAGQPLYVSGSAYPNGRAINYNAFTPVPTTGADGDAGRNLARGFDAVQQDLTLRRDFPIRESFGLQFRVEAYNIYNHPIFGSIYNSLSSGPTLFGQTYNTENSQLGGLGPLYQVGGPRSMQVALRLHF
ncbi:MAG TPA: carboxypeptidase regulatory-like domain-containing protein [Bryobacteraceae bacterium]|nr:carboxypeptidase regulatory-like domain-containing protein [Bryobacteraceae bacterium]